MPIYIAVLGIDGSGKSTLAAALPCILAAELGALTVGAGEDMRAVGPDEDHLAPKFHPDGLPLAARVAKGFRKLAKKFADNRSIYPIFKIPQMMFLDRAARKLGKHYNAEVVVCDGNALLTASGRASNYRRPASDSTEIAKPVPEVADLINLFRYVVDGKWLPSESRAKLPALGAARLLSFISQQTKLDVVWLPDIVLFLDLTPENALKRIRSRGQKMDQHENADDLNQARLMYLKTLVAFTTYGRSAAVSHVLKIDGASPGDVCHMAVDALSAQIARHRELQPPAGLPLGTTTETLSGTSFWSKVFNFNYIVRYLTLKFFRGAWREPLFVFSKLGKMFLKEGYSAGVMRVIYDQADKRSGFFDQIFLEYPLHRAVFDRLQILAPRIEAILTDRLKNGGELRIFTAPSGFAYDIFRPLEALAKRSPKNANRIKVVACDLDPHGVIKDELETRAAKLGISFEFLRGSIIDPGVREKISAGGPYDVSLFIGLSSWLPKPETVSHLKWLRSQMKPDAVLVTDCFTPDAYALSGRYIGYKAQYYTPEIYKVLIDYCGFDGLNAKVESGRDAINHVVISTVKPDRARTTELRS